MSELITFYDDCCVECDSDDIRINHLGDGLVQYRCMPCGFVWTNEDDNE